MRKRILFDLAGCLIMAATLLQGFYPPIHDGVYWIKDKMTHSVNAPVSNETDNSHSKYKNP